MATPEGAAAPSWQNSVPQAFRSEKIAEIATELARVEGNAATMQGKLALASRFENQVFTTATSINDYHSKISKRLKKLRKRYVANANAAAAAAAAAANAPGGAAAGGTAGAGGPGGAGAGVRVAGVIGGTESELKLQEQISTKKRNLRLLYGEPMRLIAENGRTAAAAYPKLIDHIDKMNEYATEIGAIPSGTLKISNNVPLKAVEGRSARDTLKYLKDLENMLESKIETLREWILKFSQEERLVVVRYLFIYLFIYLSSCYMNML